MRHSQRSSFLHEGTSPAPSRGIPCAARAGWGRPRPGRWPRHWGREDQSHRRRVEASLGPDPERFYQDYGEVATKDALAQLLSDLRATRIEEIPSALDSQRRALLIVAGLFAITAVYSTLLLV